MWKIAKIRSVLPDNFKELNHHDRDTVCLEPNLGQLRYANDCWNENERGEKERKEGTKLEERDRDKTSDHLQSATIAGESIFVMNCGPVTPTVEPILLLQVYKFLPWSQL